jgi:hypothetical protein
MAFGLKNCFIAHAIGKTSGGKGGGAFLVSFLMDMFWMSEASCIRKWIVLRGNVGAWMLKFSQICHTGYMSGDLVCELYYGCD